MEKEGGGLLLVTANVGSIFSPVSPTNKSAALQDQALIKGWIQEFAKVLRAQRPGFLGLHLQEIGGKDYATCMGQMAGFIDAIRSEAAALGLDKGAAYLDQDCHNPAEFTALGCVYLCDSRASTSVYDFVAETWDSVKDFRLRLCPPPDDECYQRRRFPQHLLPGGRWTRKGFTRTRWKRGGQEFDLVNVHLFHNASNVAAYKDPTKYPRSREHAMKFILDWILDSQEEGKETPLFIFGDFNFRLDVSKFVQRYTKDAMERNGGGEEDVIAWERKESTDSILVLGKKTFCHELGAAGLGQSWRDYLSDDHETQAFPQLHEVAISFPPSYPWSEDPGRHSELMNTRPPAWCDRVLMNDAAWRLAHTPYPPLYSSIGQDACMGDHKPVYLSIGPPPACNNSSGTTETVVAAAASVGQDLPLSFAQYSSSERAVLSYLLGYMDRKRKFHQDLTVATAFTDDFVTVITVGEPTGPLIVDGSRYSGPRGESASVWPLLHAAPVPRARISIRGPNVKSHPPRGDGSLIVVREQRSSSQEYSSLITLEGEGGEPELVFAKRATAAPAAERRRPSRVASFAGPRASWKEEVGEQRRSRSSRRVQTEPALTGDTNSLAVERERRRIRGPSPAGWNSLRDWRIRRAELTVSLRTLALIKASRASARH